MNASDWKKPCARLERLCAREEFFFFLNHSNFSLSIFFFAIDTEKTLHLVITIWHSDAQSTS